MGGQIKGSSQIGLEQSTHIFVDRSRFSLDATVDQFEMLVKHGQDSRGAHRLRETRKTDDVGEQNRDDLFLGPDLASLRILHDAMNESFGHVTLERPQATDHGPECLRNLHDLDNMAVRQIDSAIEMEMRNLFGSIGNLLYRPAHLAG